ncbi:hypothetical protein DYBT9275_04246 [Dyadobacter sp. CECT 9275]|uniref:Uncharacterized protein n=1 Tax=Dyadobacter helix TaxID=2822344 RepID=A0A916NDH8_9BACT|nr:hypothetical protein DYBT9275_04246 [Dyadobacter sp. CECT 9275]
MVLWVLNGFFQSMARALARKVIPTDGTKAVGNIALQAPFMPLGDLYIAPKPVPALICLLSVGIVSFVEKNIRIPFTVTKRRN